MNGIGMASITAFYHVHLQDKHARTVPRMMVPKAVPHHNPERVCAPFCVPSTCPILYAFLTHDDVREVSQESPAVQHVDGFGNLFG
jgi:hypothetical protein